MKFVDMAKIRVTAGTGGNGCVSFRREKFVPKGGPDGGNGGRGGNIWLVADRNLQTLADFEYKRSYKAPDGKPGSGSGRNGKSGEDLFIKVPCGTLVYDPSTMEVYADLVSHGDMFLAARGGRGGRGNRAFASSLRKAPRFAEKGYPGDSRDLLLELRMIADLGMVGSPNAGKSSLLKSLSEANPKIAPYPFTTLTPNLGVLADHRHRLVMADIPGLIEGAHENRGLGISFLRHIQRTRMLLHVLDISSANFDAILDDWSTIRAEMEAFDRSILDKPCMVVGNKLDLLSQEDRDRLLPLMEEFFAGKGMRFVPLSALSGENVDRLVEEILRFADENPMPIHTPKVTAIEVLPGPEGIDFKTMRRRSVQVLREAEGVYRIVHPHLEDAVLRYNFDHEENLVRFGRLLRSYMVDDLLLNAGAQEGDTVLIGSMEFDFNPDLDAISAYEDEDAVLPSADENSDHVE
ncbi:MAG: GTPase ObgE [Thermanaerothrix sp.]|nr:GTPase ObgE [Thermanaerothrix sp.]